MIFVKVTLLPATVAPTLTVNVRLPRRMDAIGTPFCVTIDHQTLQDDTVTIRERDTMKQNRLKIGDLRAVLEKECSMKKLLSQI